jgi:hypothetical protein
MTRTPMHEARHRRSGAILENLHPVRRAALSQANIWSSRPDQKPARADPRREEEEEED